MMRTAQHLVAKGHAVTIYAMRWEGDKPAQINVKILPQKGWFNYQRYQRFIDASFADINANGFDYVFGYNRMAGLDAHFAADPCFVERAHQQRNALYRLTPRYRWFVNCEKAIFDQASKTEVLAVSLTEKPHFEKWYGFQAERFHYIPPFLSPERFDLGSRIDMREYLRQSFGFGAQDFVYLLTGSGFAMKGLDRAITALAAMPEHLRANTRLVAVGQDKPKKFMDLANKLGINNHVVIASGRDDIPKLMQGADVCVHPARRENTGVVILEGMACGTPMLVTESCGYATHVTQADAGMVSPMPFDQARFNQAWLSMREALDVNAENKPNWGENGLRYAQNIMQANDGSAEADILIRLATEKATHD